MNTMITETKHQRSFLKWPGGKFLVLDKILGALPKGDQLIEPFAGSGVVSLNAGYRNAVVADVNQDLIQTMSTTWEQPSDVVNAAKKLFTKGNTPEVYYRRRKDFNALIKSSHRRTYAVRLAALFLYLNKHAFNGLTRYNQSGEFNVPFGNHRGPTVPEDLMHAFQTGMHADFLCQDFRVTMRNAKPGDVIYCDPPYVPLTATASFTAFSAGSFGLEEQQQLAGDARACAARGVPVLISNHDTRLTRELYHGAKITSFDVRRSISCDGGKRHPVRELLALFECK